MLWWSFGDSQSRQSLELLSRKGLQIKWFLRTLRVDNPWNGRNKPQTDPRMIFITVSVSPSVDTYGNLQSMKLAAAEKRTLNFLLFCFISSREKPEWSDISFQIIWKNSSTYFSLIMRHYPFIEKKRLELPRWSRGWDSMLPMQESWVQSLMSGLRFNMPLGVAKNKNRHLFCACFQWKYVKSSCLGE